MLVPNTLSSCTFTATYYEKYRIILGIDRSWISAKGSTTMNYITTCSTTTNCILAANTRVFNFTPK